MRQKNVRVGKNYNLIDLSDLIKNEEKKIVGNLAFFFTDNIRNFAASEHGTT